MIAAESVSQCKALVAKTVGVTVDVSSIIKSLPRCIDNVGFDDFQPYKQQIQLLRKMKQRGTSLAQTAALRRSRYIPLSHRPFSLSSRLAVESSSTGPSSTTTEKPSLPRLNLDASTSSLLHDLHLGTGTLERSDTTKTGGLGARRKYRRPIILDEKELEALNDERRIEGTEEWILTEAGEEQDARNLDGRTNEDDSGTSYPLSTIGEGSMNEHDSEDHRREERRSPAAVFGNKRIGSVVLPEKLQEAIQQQIDGMLIHPRIARASDLNPRST